jgi:hypothetical protein
MHRHWPAEGFEIWCDMMHEWEPPFLATELLPGDMRRAVTLEEYDAALIEQWSWFAREKHWTDHLIIDAMHYARQTGWIICGPDTVVQSTEAILDDLARRSGAKRAAVEADMKAASDRCDARHYRFIDLDDAYYHRWIEAGAPDGRKARFSRWKKRRKEEDEAIARFEAARAPGIPMPTSAGPLRIVPAALPDLLTSSADFIAGFVPPEASGASHRRARRN